MIPDILTPAFINSYKDKIAPFGFNGMGYFVYKRCVTIETPVLCADLTWKAAGDIPVGTEIVGFEEEAAKGSLRKIVRSQITHNTIEDADCVEIELEDGTLLYSTPDHSWLAKTPYGLAWVEAQNLVHANHIKRGSEIHCSLPKYCDMWAHDTSYEAGYLAAAFDGEGSIDRKRTLTFTQTDNEMLATVRLYLDKYGFQYRVTKKSKSLAANGTSFKTDKPCFQLSIYGNDQVMRFLGMFRPKRLLRVYMSLDVGMAMRRRGSAANHKRVVRVTSVGKRKIAVISTSSKTHITAGYPSHNTYARLKADGNTEEWYETVGRCVNGAQRIGAEYTEEEAKRLFDHVFNLRCNFAGRMLWQLGTPTVERFGANSLLNCWFCAINEPKAFLFLFENLMLGGGVGFSIRREDVHELPRIKPGVVVEHQPTKDADFIVPDSRAGWVKLLERVLNAYYVTGESFTYSTILVRGAGETIKGFGGTASGPKILIEGIQKICRILASREEKKLRSLDALDVCNIIGSIVVAGNVRRSALIALGDPDDYLYLRAKNWSLGNVPNWRAMSNNTIYADSFEHISEEIWGNGYMIDDKTGYAKGEPYGFFNLPLSQRYGRLKDGPMKDSNLYPADRDNVIGTNPCAEISLASYECCNLSELYLNNVSSEEELIDCAKLLYKTQKAISAMPFLHKETDAIVHRNMRLGLGVTGICQSLDKVDWLDKCYVELRKFDKEWSKKRGWPASIKLTTIKPSGTLSLLGGATPGVHPAYSEYYIRRVRVASGDKLVDVCRKNGYNVEYVKNFDGSENRDTVVVEFPCKTPKGAVLAKDTTVIKQLDMVAKLQHIWSDNAVSVTAYYETPELPALKEWLKDNYEKSIKSVSFLLRDKHGFLQAPYQSITQEEYEAMAAKITPLATFSEDVSGDAIAGIECEGGACPIK
jgi:hypothetical protein